MCVHMCQIIIDHWYAFVYSLVDQDHYFYNSLLPLAQVSWANGSKSGACANVVYQALISPQKSLRYEAILTREGDAEVK